MNKLILFAAVAALSALPAAAQSPATCNNAAIPLCGVATPASDIQIKPQAVPTSTTVVAFSDAQLKVFTVSNPTSGAISFSLCDRQASPVCAVPAVSVAANTVYIAVWPDGRLYWCPGGFTFLASSAGLTAQGKFQQ